MEQSSSQRALENLHVWCHARKFVASIYVLFRDNKDYGFKDQIQRAAVSIMNNIAEGFDSGSDSLFLRYLHIAKGSCSEVRSMLYLCEDLGYCTAEQESDFQTSLYTVSSEIFKLIKFLQNKQKPI